MTILGGNIDLSAAAPELLAALKEMVADLISHARLGLNESELAMLKRAEAAIAKAEGQKHDGPRATETATK